MSIIDTANPSVVTYDGKNKAFTGQRLARFSWKTVSDKNSPMCGIKRDSKCVSLPPVSGSDVSSNLESLMPHLTSYLHSVQDKMIREMIEGQNSCLSISTESVSIGAICDWLEQNDESGRITKESVNNWFDSNLSDSLALALAEKLGVSEVPSDAESAKILAVVDAFKGKIAALAGGKTSYEPKICTSLINALDLVGEGDVMASRFKVRLNKMIADSKAGEELLDLL